MTALVIVLAVLVVLLTGALVAVVRGVPAGPGRARRAGGGSAAPAPSSGPAAPAGRIVFPFFAAALSRRALDAALRLARAEGATLVPVFLARVPLHLPLDSPLPRQSAIAIPLQEAIEQRAAAYGVPVDSRLERGRTYRHALRQTIEHERFERIVVAAATEGGHGFDPDDVAWLLGHAPGEIVVLRPGEADQLMPAAVHPARRPSRPARDPRGRRAAPVGSSR